MPVCALKVALLRHTEAPEQLTALGAKLCYSGMALDALAEAIEKKDQDTFVKGLISSGHYSVMEHASFTFAIEGVSRILLAQLTRHRIASFSVQSQRYVSMKGELSYVIPPAIEALGEDAARTYAGQMETMHRWYLEWQRRLGGAGEKSNEDARFVLPGASETRLIVTMNARELLHFFSLRCCRRAQWEIRRLAERMLGLVMEVAPTLFKEAGPPCVSGPCPEGAGSCGQSEAVIKHIKEIKGENHAI